MLTKTKIYKKYASSEQYKEYADETVRSLQTKFPQVQLRSWGEFKTFLDSLIPKLVHKYLILSGSMKNCSGISPDFAEIGAQAGFPVIVDFSPGHQYNVVLTTEGPYKVDLTYIQFTCNHDWNDDEAREEVMKNYRELYRNPSKAVKIEKLPEQSFAGRLPHGEYHTFSPDPMQSIQKYDPEKTEKVFPEIFKKYK